MRVSLGSTSPRTFVVARAPGRRGARGPQATDPAGCGRGRRAGRRRTVERVDEILPVAAQLRVPSEVQTQAVELDRADLDLPVQQRQQLDPRRRPLDGGERLAAEAGCAADGDAAGLHR
jgi:hypothetical protein